MLAPTVVYGPDGSHVKPGETIPDEWFTAMPDLADHLRRHDPDAAPTAAVSLTGRGTRKRAGKQS